MGLHSTFCGIQQFCGIVCLTGKLPPFLNSSLLNYISAVSPNAGLTSFSANLKSDEIVCHFGVKSPSSPLQFHTPILHALYIDEFVSSCRCLVLIIDVDLISYIYIIFADCTDSKLPIHSINASVQSLTIRYILIDCDIDDTEWPLV